MSLLSLYSLSSIFFFFITVTLVVQSGAQYDLASCPLDFEVLRKLVDNSARPTLDVSTNCQYIRQGLRLVQSQYLRTSNSFLPPINSSESCWDSYQSLIDSVISNFDIRSSCGFQTAWISEGCMNITTRSDFETRIPDSVLSDVVRNCNQSLENGSPCSSCTTSLSSLQASYLTGASVGNVSDCTSYPSIYAAAIANHFGPTDSGTASCLFFLDFTSNKSKNKRRKILILVALIGSGVGLLILIGGFWWRRRREKLRLKKAKIERIETDLVGTGLDSISGSTTLIRFTIDDIKKATKNFSRQHNWERRVWECV